MLIEKDKPHLYQEMKTKIGASASIKDPSHFFRDGNSNFTLMIDSVTKNVMNFDCVYKHDQELNDCISNSIVNRS